MVTEEKADIAIITLPITNYPAQVFSSTSMVPVVHIDHTLAKLEQVSTSDLLNHCQIVIRDLGGESSENDTLDVGWLKSNQRITVDNFDHAIKAIEHRLGFCRLPEHMLQHKKYEEFQILKIENNEKYQVPLHITLPKGSKTGKAALAFFELLLQNTDC